MPDWKEEVRKRLADARIEPARESEIVEELAQHLDDVYQRSIARGLSEHESTQIALRELADANSLPNELTRIQKPFHETPVAGGPGSSATRGGRSNMLTDFIQDLRYAGRMQLKNPGFTVVAVIALALGIGANTAIFSVVNSVLLRPLPYRDPERLVMVWEDASKFGYPRDTPAAANYVDWRDQNTVFEGMAAIADESFNLTGAGDPERLEGRSVTANFFPLLGVDPLIGRTFTSEEDKRGSDQVVVLSHALWQRRFGGDNGIIGKTINLNGLTHTVVGVMP